MNNQNKPLSPEQIAELDRRLDAFEADHDMGQPASEAVKEIRSRITNKQKSATGEQTT